MEMYYFIPLLIIIIFNEEAHIWPMNACNVLLFTNVELIDCVAPYLYLFQRHLVISQRYCGEAFYIFGIAAFFTTWLRRQLNSGEVFSVSREGSSCSEWSSLYRISGFWCLAHPKDLQGHLWIYQLASLPISFLHTHYARPVSVGPRQQLPAPYSHTNWTPGKFEWSVDVAPDSDGKT